MSVKRVAVDYAYGLGDALIPLAPLPIIADRDPASNDYAQLGTTWVNRVDSSVWVLASVTNNSANWTTSPASGIGAFTSLAINPGNVNLVAGNLTLGAGNISLTSGNLAVGGDLTVGGTISFSGDIDFTSPGLIDVISTLDAAPSILLEANGGTSEQVQLHSNQGTAADSILLVSDAGGITFDAALATANAFVFSSVSGGLNVDVGHQISLTTTRSAADSIEIISTAGGIDISALGASAGEDIDISAIGSSINIAASESVADAIVINAAGAAGGVQINAGTGGILIGNTATCNPIDIGDTAPTASRTITVAGGTVVTAAVTDLVDIAPDGATTNADSVKRVDVCSGNITTGQSIVNINTGTAASGTSTVNISTGTGGGTKAVNIGNVDGLTAVTIHGSAVAQTAGTTFDIDAAGALSLNSSAAAINVGNDAVAQAINVGTGAAARTITVGNITGATAVNVNAGTGGFNVASAGIVTIDVITDSQASPSATSVINANVGSATFTGFTTASAAAQVFTITNSLVSATSSILVSSANEGSNDAQMTVTRVERGSGTFDVTLLNNGAAALNGDVTVTFFVLS